MKPGPFDYEAPASLTEAVRLLADQEREAKVLAGGQSLIPMLNMRLARPGLLVDITRVPELSGLYVDEAGHLHVGAAVRQAAAAAAPEVRAGWPLLAGAIAHIGHPQIRNRGTVCGSLVHHDPAAELPAASLALEARFTIVGPGGNRTVTAEDFFVSTFQTAVGPDEILTEVVFPPAPGDGWSFAEHVQRRGDFAAVGVAVALARRQNAMHRVRVVFCGAGPLPVRVPEAESALEGRPLDAEALEGATALAGAALDPPKDVHASAEWRREGAQTLLRQALTEAWERTA
ncbi:FAD binding domain-containing protein [Streptomyces reniochalinae]|uniref:Xanthine dehydrogenase family protein subunit M n=1 Tax=Streptomyces reniochalinae TaxID=2250578 RepID=A0A367ED95_9ACTN|nr:xanthine dehydrogenase family protein subunit M [Streptomyces reniochalinae]RCG16046.1 xanthine dehydrogenase family protein subunit M [Streptomyces reniochalinae]